MPQPPKPNDDATCFVLLAIVLFVLAVLVWSYLQGDLRPLP